MTGVPLLRLPLLPQLEILKSVDTKDLFYLSCISTRSKALVQLANRSIEGVNLQFRMEKELYVFTEKAPLLRLKEKVDLATFQGVDKMAICSVVKFPIVFYEAGKYHDIENRVIQHLFSVFKKVEKMAVYLTDVEKVIPNPLWNYTKNLDDLIVSIQKRKLTDEEVTFLVKELTVSDKLSISAPTQSFKYQNGFTHEKMSFVFSQFPTDTIIASRSSTIYIECPSFPPATELNRLLKAWVAGGSMVNLKQIFFESDEDHPPGYLDAITDGIFTFIRSSTVRHIRRDNGERAVVGLDTKVFRFYV